MARPSYRHRVGLIEIENQKKKIREEQKKLDEKLKQKQKPISKEEHEERLKKLKEFGLLK